MIAELDIHGVFVPALLIWAIIALPFTALLTRLFAWAGVYRFVWRQPLFDLALFTIVLGGVTAISKWIMP